MLMPGEHVDRYELICPIGEGGMAQVWVARQRGKHGFEKLFALKAIHHRFADDPTFRAMFLDEARIASAIDHPQVAQVFDLGESKNVLYLVMEYVDGDSLSGIVSAIARRGDTKTATVPAAIALRIVADVLTGLDAAHRLRDAEGRPRGVVHRDVSPSNILVSVRGDAKVIDFGIAHAADRASGDTGAGSLKGKVNYMAPEQVLKQPLGPYTDVFGAGATLFKLLSGRPAYDGGSEANTLALLMSGAAAPPLGDPISPLVSAIVARALSPDPGDRYVSAQEMANAIEAAIAEEGYVADVGSWARNNLSDRAKARREQLATEKKKIAVDVPDLAPARAPVVAPAAFAETAPMVAVDEHATKTPGFMDVRAIVARGPVQPIAEQAEDAEEREPHAKIERKPVSPAEVGAPKPKPRRAPTSLKALAIGAGLVGVAVAGAVLIAPRIVKDRAIARARELGVELDVGSSAVGLSGITLSDVKARVPRVPELTALRVERIEIVGFTGSEVRVTGLDATLDGALDDVGEKALALVNEDRARLAGTPDAPRRYVLVSGRATWMNAFGQGTRVDAGQIGVDAETKGAGVEEVRASIARFDVKSEKTTFGPWGLSYERMRDVTRARLLLDPPLMDGPSALVVWDRVGKTELTVRIPRSGFANLGIRPAEIGLPTDAATEIEAQIDGQEDAAGKVTGKGKVDLWGARVKGFSSPVDIHVDAAANGVAGKPLDLDKTTVSIGPFVATMNGTLALQPSGFRIDATWKTAPILCEKLVRAKASEMGTIIEAIQDLAQRTGAARVTGTANASGLLRYDTKSPGDVGVTWTTKDTCGVSLFGF